MNFGNQTDVYNRNKTQEDQHMKNGKVANKSMFIDRSGSKNSFQKNHAY